MTKTRWTFGKWALASALGLSLGIPGGVAAGAPLEVVVGAMLVTPVMLGLVGAVLGAAQWTVIRDLVPRAWNWIALTAAGFAVGLTLALVLVERGGELLTGAPVRMSSTGALGLVVALTVLGGLGGAIVGAAQAAFLRRHGGTARHWVTASALGLTAGFLAGFAMSTLFLGGLGSAAGLALFLVVSGLVYGAVTGRAFPLVESPA